MRERAVKDIMCKCKSYWGDIKPEQYPEENEEDEGDFINDNNVKTTSKNMKKKYTKTGSKQGGKVETNLLYSSSGLFG